MAWTNVKLIWQREVRDQLRDRRTLFTIAVLPLLLYPLLGMSFLEITQFMKAHPSQIWIAGTADAAGLPQLLADERFQEPFCPAEEARLLQLTVLPELPEQFRGEDSRRVARRDIQAGTYDVLLYFPSGHSQHLQQAAQPAADQPPSAAAANPAVQPELYVDFANEKSRLASDRLERILSRWRKALVAQNLAARQVPPSLVDPFTLRHTDVAEESHRRAALWSKLLPFVVVIWALTGAFYPAIDLCAGEKERGTLETLLCSPADRREIVWGKLLTVMLFSGATSLLNLLCMGLTGRLIIQGLPELGERLHLGSPPLSAVLWLLLAIVPISALFSALALSVAAFARSSKEGQYYLMPLVLIMFPLMTLTMLPSAELDWGTSLIPVSGMLLWLRVLIEGEYVEGLRYALPVIGMTAGCCWLAIRWAVRQFESESVLFRESERFGPGLWLRHLVRDREPTPGVPQAVLCGLLLLLIKFFAGLSAAMPESLSDLARTLLATQLGLILAPVLIMTPILTSDPRQTLLLRLPRWTTVAAAFLLAVALNPLAKLLPQLIQQLYPLSEEAQRLLGPLESLLRNAPPSYVICILALAPAICEELAFRGFILSGLTGLRNNWAAIGISSLFFGLTHGLIQQSLAAAIVGLVLGYLAVRSGSIVPSIVFHCTHNSLSLLSAQVTADTLLKWPVLEWLFCPSVESPGSYAYRWPWLIVSVLAGASLLYGMARRSARRSD